MEALQGQDRSSRERDKERDDWLWTAASLTAGLHRFVQFISNFKGYFGSSVISCLSWDLLSCSGHIFYSTPQHDNHTLASSSNEMTFQPGSDLWSLTEKPTARGACSLLQRIKEFIPVRIQNTNVVTLMMLNSKYFWNLLRGAACNCMWSAFVARHQRRLRTADRFAKCSQSVAAATRPLAWTDLTWTQRTTGTD